MFSKAEYHRSFILSEVFLARQMSEKVANKPGNLKNKQKEGSLPGVSKATDHSGVFRAPKILQVSTR